MKFNMKRFLKILTVWLVCALASIFFLFAGCSDKSLNMRSDNQLQSPEDSEYGIYTKLTLTLDCGDGKVWATVKNTYTLLPSTVRVTVELYKSERPVSSYREMELAAENSINDLDIFQTLTVEASTGGKGYYWQARMYYRIDNGEWQEQVTEVMSISADGKFILTDASHFAPEEFYGKSFCVKDDVEGLPNTVTVYQPREIQMPTGDYDELGEPITETWIMGTNDKYTEDEQEINYLYNLLSSATFETTRFPYVSSMDYRYSIKMVFEDLTIRFYFHNDIFHPGNEDNGYVYGQIFKNNSSYAGLVADLNEVDFEGICRYIDSLMNSTNE